MISDFHLHTWFSGDSKADPEKMIERGIALGMNTICFTDHCDTDCGNSSFVIDVDAYIEKMSMLRDKYRHQIEVCIGVELGMQPHLAKQHKEYVNRYPFDFVIGSQHLVDGKDPYYPEVFQQREDREVYLHYFEQLYDNVRAFTDYQVLGHIDYVVRYGKYKEKQYNYAEYADIIDGILRKVIEDGRGIEVKTAGLKYGLGFPNPHMDILRRYHELGGEIVTIGSDAHAPEYMGYEFSRIAELLKHIGFGFFAKFRQKTVNFFPL
jgi:histidinol-phosphatase (PHP family)